MVDEAEAAAAPPKTLAQSVFIRLVRFLIARGSVTQDLGGLADRLANHDPARLGAVPCPVLSGVLAECCREWGVAVGEEEREAVVDALPRVKRWQLERTHGRSGGDPWGEDGDADMWGVPASPGCHQPGAAAAPLCWYTTLLSEFNAEVQTHSQVVSQVRHTVRSGACARVPPGGKRLPVSRSISLFRAHAVRKPHQRSADAVLAPGPRRRRAAEPARDDQGHAPAGPGLCAVRARRPGHSHGHWCVRRCSAVQWGGG